MDSLDVLEFGQSPKLGQVVILSLQVAGDIVLLRRG
jgi:hypothetical protein